MMKSQNPKTVQRSLQMQAPVRGSSLYRSPSNARQVQCNSTVAGKQPESQALSSKSFLVQPSNGGGQKFNSHHQRPYNSTSSHAKVNPRDITNKLISSKRGFQSRNSFQSLASCQNRLNSMSSKGLLSTMPSNAQLLQSEKNLKRDERQPLKVSAINKIHFTSSQDSNQNQLSQRGGGPRKSQQGQGSPASQNKSLTPAQPLNESIQLKHQGKHSRRESFLSSFDERDISEGVRASSSKQVPSQLASKVKASISKPKLQPLQGSQAINRKVFEMKQQDSLFESTMKDLSFKEIVKAETPLPEQFQSQRTASNRYKPTTQLSQIDPLATQLNESKPSESELNIWFGLSQEKQSAKLGKSSKQLQKLDQSQLSNPYQYASGAQTKSQEHKDNVKTDMMRVVDSHERLSSDEYTEMSEPVELADDHNQMLSSEGPEHSSSCQSVATKGIQTYLKSLNKLKQKYRDIYHDLIMEENQNIQLTTQQILNSEEFLRLSVTSRSMMLANKIVGIRDEYRHVIQLLKTQHNFSGDSDEEMDS